MSTDRFQGEHMRAAFEFRKLMGQPIYADDLDTLELQWDLICEEFDELEDELVKPNEYEDYTIGHDFNKGDALKELADLVYVCFQLAAALGWDLDEALRRIHQSNLSKLVDGKPLRRPNGKVLKGPNYQPPSLHDLI